MCVALDEGWMKGAVRCALHLMWLDAALAVFVSARRYLVCAAGAGVSETWVADRIGMAA